MEQQEQGVPQAAPQKKSNVWLWVIGGCLTVVILIGVIIFGLGWWGVNKVKKEMKNINTEETFNKIKDVANENGADISDSIKDSLTGLITKGAGVKCSVTSPEDGTTMKVSAKNKNVKIEGLPNNVNSVKEGNSTMLTVGDWVYIWSGKEGMKFNVTETEKLSAENGTQNNQSLSEQASWESLVNEWESSGTNYNCDPAILTDSDFAVPADVKFIDFGESMKQLQNLGNNTSQIPAGFGQ